MSSRIILDPRLPADLDEATSATTADWLTIQKDGETGLRKISPAALIPPGAAGTFTNSLNVTGGALSGSFQTFGQLQMTVNSVSDALLVLVEAELVVLRPNGTGAFGGTMRVLRNGAVLTSESYVCYADGGYGSITIPSGAIGAGYPQWDQEYPVDLASLAIGGGRCVTARMDGLAPGNYLFALQARYVGTANYGLLNNGRITIARFGG